MSVNVKIDGELQLLANVGGGGGGSTVEWEQLQTEGTKVATITIDDDAIDVYVPESSEGTTDYEKLENLPTLNGETIKGAVTIDVPTKTSELTNDSSFITSSDIPTIPSKTSELTNDSGFLVSSDLTSYALASQVGYDLGLSVDADYIMKIELKNNSGTVVSTKSVDLPIESMVVGADYSDGKLTLTLQSGDTVDVDISAIVSGLVNDTFTIAGIDMKDNITASELKTALGVPSSFAPTDAEKNVQSDWNVTDTTSDAYIKNKITKVSELTNDSGFTSNVGTVTGITMNGSAKTVSSTGVVDLGTVITDVSGKQDALTSQTAYTSKGSATKVPQITTNTLGQVTGITEVTITQPDVSGKENSSNKVTAWSTTTTDAHYPSEKLVKGALDNKVDKVTGKGLSTNDFTSTYKTAIDNLPISYAPTDAEKNVIVGIKKNGTAITVGTDRTVNVTVPTQASDIGAMASTVTHLSGDVPTTRTVNGKALSSDITLTASDVSARSSTWTPTKSDIGLGNVGNFKAVSTVASQGLTDTEKSNARANIGAGTSSFSGSYNDLTNKPTIPSAVTESTVSGWGFTKNTGTYSKPSTGIPKTDLASGVQTSLGKADTALQSISKTDVTTALGYTPPTQDTNTTYSFGSDQTSIGGFYYTPKGGTKEIIYINGLQALAYASSVDYSMQVTNIPMINSTPLKGNLSADDLLLASKGYADSLSNGLTTVSSEFSKYTASNDLRVGKLETAVGTANALLEGV